MRVYFQDEARFGQQGTLTRVWARTGSRPTAVRQTRYDYLYVLGAACPETGHTAGLLMPYLNTDAVNVFLDGFSKELDPNVHAALIWDRAGYHTSKKLKVPPNVSLIELPPKSPELNPIENLWHYLRSHHWANKAYRDFDHLCHAASDAWQRSCLDPERVKTVCAAPYLQQRQELV